MSEYHVEKEKPACATCGCGGNWIVIDPDGFGGSVSYDLQEDAQEVADMLQDAFQKGIAKGSGELPKQVVI